MLGKGAEHIVGYPAGKITKEANPQPDLAPLAITAIIGKTSLFTGSLSTTQLITKAIKDSIQLNFGECGLASSLISLQDTHFFQCFKNLYTRDCNLLLEFTSYLTSYFGF
jgi:hypothetical protein